MTMGNLLHKTAFPKSNSITRPAKAKVQFKMGSTYEALNTTKRTFKRIDRINLHDLRERIYYSGGKSGGILVIMPEQNQSRDRSPTLGSKKTLLGDELNMHSGNLLYDLGNLICGYKLSNYGDTLKLIIPSLSRKVKCG